MGHIKSLACQSHSKLKIPGWSQAGRTTDQLLPAILIDSNAKLFKLLHRHGSHLANFWKNLFTLR